MIPPPKNKYSQQVDGRSRFRIPRIYVLCSADFGLLVVPSLSTWFSQSVSTFFISFPFLHPSPRVFIFDSMLTSPRSLLHNYASPRLQYFNHIRCFARTVQTDPTTMSIVYHRHPPRPTLPPSDICIIVATSLLWSDYCSLFLSACTVYIAIKTE
jgi:hypothetical protein